MIGQHHRLLCYNKDKTEEGSQAMDLEQVMDQIKTELGKI